MLTEVRTFGWENVQEFCMPHPRTGIKSLFLFGTKEGSNETLTYEVLTMQQETRSWFVGDSVISDGNLYVCTPVDPLFLTIPALVKSGKAKPLADHMCESSLPRAVADSFSKCLSHKQLSNIATKKEFDDLVVFAYSEENTLAWLSKKAEKVAKLFSDKGISHAEASVSSNFVQSAIVVGKEDSLRYACDIVGEYVDDSLKGKLLEKFGLPVLQEKTGTKRKGILESEDDNLSNKKTKMTASDGVPLEDYGSTSNLNTPANKTTKITAREKGLQKAAAGSHSLFKFFIPKSK